MQRWLKAANISLLICLNVNETNKTINLFLSALFLEYKYIYLRFYVRIWDFF